MHLQKKLIITYLIVAIIPLMAVALLSYTNFRESLLTVQQISLENIADLKVKMINDYFGFWRKEMTATKDRLIVRDSLPTISRLNKEPSNPEYKQARDLFESQMGDLIQENKEIDNIYFVNLDGFIVYATHSELEQQSINRLFPVYGAKVMENGMAGVYLSDLYKHNSNETIDFLVSAPVYDFNNVFSGVIILELNPTKLYQSLVEYGGLGDTGEVLLAKRVSEDSKGVSQSQFYDANGNSVLFLNPLRFDPQAAFKRTLNIGDVNGKSVQDAVQGINGSGFNTDYRGVLVLSAWRYLPENNLGLVVKVDLTELLLPVKNVSEAIIVFSLVSFLVIFFISWLFSKTIINPIKDLHKASEIIATGNLDYQVNIETGDEIEQLGHAFNDMALALKKSRIGVDKKIEEQTKQIKDRAKSMEEQQIAILNILEDVEKEKDKVEIIANDLKKFELAVNNASDQIVITDTDGIILYANSALERITGFKVKEVLGKKVGTKELWGGKTNSEFYQKMWKTIKINKKTFSGELINHRKDGTNYNVLASISPVLDKKNKVIYFVGIERDITREKEIDKMKTEFVSVASHQLRTPLTAIKWYVEEIYNGELGKLNKDQKDYLKQILESNERMIRLVNDLLNVSRLESGRVTIEPTPTDLIGLINSIISECVVLAKARNCELKFIKPKTKLPEINIDPSLIRQVVNNLMSNAIKYSKVGGGKSLVIVELSKKPPNVIISVKDEGIGIAKEHQHRVFDKFFRADNAIKSETEGTGLGLYIAKMIVEDSGGKIWFKSNDQGTTFTFSLPLAGSKERKGEKSLA